MLYDKSHFPRMNVCDSYSQSFKRAHDTSSKRWNICQPANPRSNRNSRMETWMMEAQTGVFTTRNPDVLEHKKGGGRLIFLGLPFFLAGLFVAQIPFGFIPVEVEGGPLVLAILVPLGPLFAFVGFVLMLSRSGITIDRSSRIAVQWWGLFLPFHRKVYSLDLFSVVQIAFREGDRNTPDTFSISLVGADSKNTIHIIDLGSYDLAKRAADELAQFTHKPIDDLAKDPQDI